MKLNPRYLALLPLGLMLIGCSDVGDTNPVSPEKMSQMRKKEADERSNFHPSGSSPAGAPGGTGK